MAVSEDRGQSEVVSDEIDVYHPACAEGRGGGGACVLVRGEESVGVIGEGVKVLCIR
jgi:hypothetical protein